MIKIKGETPQIIHTLLEKNLSHLTFNFTTHDAIIQYYSDCKHSSKVGSK